MANLKDASVELARILAKDGEFNIITANPESYDVWRTFFEDYSEDGKLISGKVRIPINPLSRNDFYMHTMDEMISALEDAGLEIVSTKPIGTISTYPEQPLFVSVQGRRKGPK